MSKYLCFYFFLGLPLLGLQAQDATKMTTEQYIEKYKQVAISEMYRSRIPASITLAQGILESGSGNSRLATEANNHFGIKCKKDWTGRTLHEDDDAPQECFRAYNTAEESYRDHSEFLMKSTRYAFLFDLEPTDYKGWAQGLKKAGYATNPNYPQLLIGFIEKHNLHQYDHVKAGEEKKEEVKKEKEIFVQQHIKASLSSLNGIPATVARKGDSFAKIALENDLMVWQIYKYNDLPRDAQPSEGDTLYLKPKHNKGSVATCEVGMTDNMHRIAQRYGIKLKHLYKRNNMDFGTEAAWGETLHLQKHRKGKPRLVDQNEVYRKMLIPQGGPAPAPLPATPVPAPASVPVPVTPVPVTPVPVTPVPERKQIEVVEEHKDTVAKPHIQIPQEERAPLPSDTAAVREEIRAEAATPVQPVAPVTTPEELKADSIQMSSTDTSTSFTKEEELVNTKNATENIDAATKPLEQLPPEKRADPSVDNGEETFLHTVQPKETLYSISRKYNLKVAALKDLNKLSSDTIHIGQQLVVNAHNASTARAQMVKTGVHVVTEQETLYGIARAYKLSVDELIALNQLKDLNVRVGQELIILKNNPAPAVTEPVKAPEQPVYHTVQSKETLYSLSRKYNITVEELMKLNNMSDFALQVGQQLRVK